MAALYRITIYQYGQVVSEHAVTWDQMPNIIAAADAAGQTYSIGMPSFDDLANDPDHRPDAVLAAKWTE
jgi:hypothetical protein